MKRYVEIKSIHGGFENNFLNYTPIKDYDYRGGGQVAITFKNGDRIITHISNVMIIESGSEREI